MPRSPGPSRRIVITILLVSTFLGFLFVTTFRNLSQGTRHPDYELTHDTAVSLAFNPEILTGDVIAPKLGNETLKAELGRAAWKLFHTTFARFPDQPSDDESLALLTYVHLFARLYPCGECATHFRQILQQYPPQVSSRSTAAAWGCHVHNEVNKSLNKEIFDCSKIGDFYDCGCAEDSGTQVAAKTGMSGVHSAKEPAKDEMEAVSLSHEDWQRGG